MTTHAALDDYFRRFRAVELLDAQQESLAKAIEVGRTASPQLAKQSKRSINGSGRHGDMEDA